MYTLPSSAAVSRVGARVVGALMLLLLIYAPAARAEFGITPGGFSTSLSTSQAGAAADLTTSFALNMTPGGSPDQNLKDMVMDLPGGMIGDTTAAPTCRTAQLLSFTGCPADSQVGVLMVNLVPSPGFIVTWRSPVYNLDPPSGAAAELGAVVFSPTVSLVIRVRSEDDYGLRTEMKNTSAFLPVAGATLQLWGVPADPSHDVERGFCGQTSWDPTDTCPSTAPRRAFLRNPSRCGAQGNAIMSVDSWQAPSHRESATADVPEITGCDKLPDVEPRASIQPADRSVGSPAGYDIDLDIPQVTNPDAVATPPLKQVTIDFPNGTAISPGSADGLGACTDAQLHQHDTAAVECPNASKIGTVEITTPYLDEHLEGSMFLGEPKPGDQFRLFMVAEGSGVSVRLIGSAQPDPATGHLKATFENLPQIAFSHLHVHMKGGPRAVLVNPSSCGTATSTTTVTPYGGGADASDTSSFDVTGDCSAPGFAPTLSAGTTNPVAGADSPFVLQIKRSDGQQDLKSVAMDLPAGLIGSVAGLPLCSTAAAAAGTCSDSSLVGSVSVAVGTGSNPISLPGRVYMTQGNGSAPLGLSFVVPAKIGPFDFGTVIVPASVEVDPFTGALHVQTGEMPSIIAGIPLHYRAITVNLDRAGFMRNPTSCAEQKIAGAFASAGGSAASASTRFQVAGCGDLDLKPTVKMTINGAKERKRNGQPGFSVLLSQTAGQSNLKAVAVTLPGDLGLSLGLPQPCTVAQFKARACPAASKLGDSSVTTPLLDGKLQGGVYLVAADKAGSLPRLGVLLQGLVPISLLSNVSVAGGHVTTTFGAPDLPISTFKLTLNTKTALTAARNLCGRKQKAHVAMLGASGARYRSTVTVPVQGCVVKKSKAKASRTA